MRDPAFYKKHADKTRSRRRNIRPQILRMVAELTPGAPPCCSSDEVAANMREQGEKNITARGVASVLGKLYAEGLVKSTLLAQRHLWSITPKGQAWLRTH